LKPPILGLEPVEDGGRVDGTGRQQSLSVSEQSQPMTAEGARSSQGARPGLRPERTVQSPSWPSICRKCPGTCD
jgi:hypothetical protein